MEMPKPGPAHQKLAKLAGEWSGDEKLHPSPWDPKGGAAVGKCSNKVVLDGFAVVQDYEQQRGGVVAFRGHGVFSIDAEKNQPSLHWFDSMGGQVALFHGDWKGDELVMDTVTPMGNLRCTFAVRANTYTFKMEASPDGKKWIPTMEGSYRK
jgi:hypothetical protein